MTADISAFDSRLAAMNTKLDLVLTGLADLQKTGKPGLTQREFAKLLGKNPRTITRWVAGKRIRLVRGCVPHETVRQFLS